MIAAWFTVQWFTVMGLVDFRFNLLNRFA